MAHRSRLPKETAATRPAQKPSATKAQKPSARKTQKDRQEDKKKTATKAQKPSDRKAQKLAGGKTQKKPPHRLDIPLHDGHFCYQNSDYFFAEVSRR